MTGFWIKQDKESRQDVSTFVNAKEETWRASWKSTRFPKKDSIKLRLILDGSPLKPYEIKWRFKLATARDSISASRAADTVVSWIYQINLITERCQRIGNNTLVLNGKGNLQEQPFGVYSFWSDKVCIVKKEITWYWSCKMFEWFSKWQKVGDSTRIARNVHGQRPAKALAWIFRQHYWHPNSAADNLSKIIVNDPDPLEFTI